MNAAPLLTGALSNKGSNKGANHGDSQLARILADMCRQGAAYVDSADVITLWRRPRPYAWPVPYVLHAWIQKEITIQDVYMIRLLLGATMYPGAY